MSTRCILLAGGLGNQMFEYAFYLSMLEKGRKCVIDTTLYDFVEMHNGYELERVFGIKDSIVPSGKFHQLWIKALLRFKPTFLIYYEKNFQFCEDVYSCPQPYLKGYWMNPSYFESIAPKVRNMFSFKNINKQNEDLATKMRYENSIAIHIRRGDYLINPIYNVCDEEYYTKGIKYFIERFIDPVFYVFSDDPKWSGTFMESFHIQYHIIDNNQGFNSYQDMYLMTQCKHIIIANSSFSWWGAWLNINKTKIVVAPEKWFKKGNLNANCEDWHLIDNR